MIRLMLVDDHVSAREPLAFMLEQHEDLTVTATAGSIAEARQRLDDGVAVDVAILDLGLPDGWGTELVEAVHAAHGHAVTLVLTSFSDHVVLAEAICAGAAGVLHKSADVDEIVRAVRTLAAGEQLVSAREVAEAIRLAGARRVEGDEARRRLERLTPRERDVLVALGEGLPDKEIADRLVVGVGTVRTHVTSLLAKLGARSRLEAVVIGARHGAIDLGPSWPTAAPIPGR